MRIRASFAALIAAAMLALPTAAADAGPGAVIQFAPTGKILSDIRAAANIVAGDAGSKFVNDFFKEHLGEKGFSGLDLAKPVLGYVIFDEKDAEKSAFVLLASFTKEEEFLDFLTRCHLEPTAVKDSKGLYKLGTFDLPMNDKPVTYEVMMRLVEQTAYIGFNVKAEGLDPAKLYKADKLYDPKETALLHYKQFNDRISPEVLQGNLKSLPESIAKMKEQLGAGAGENVIFEALEKLIASMVKVSLEAKETGSRITLDIATGEFAVDTWYTPKAGTDFAKSLAARKPSVNQFAGLADNTTVGGVMLQLPVGLKEMQDLILAGLAKAQEEIKNDPPPPFAKDLVDEGIKGVIRTVKGGSWDLAATLNGPDKDGHFVGAFGMIFEDALPLEKAIKANLKNFPAVALDCVKLDVDKIGEINIHSFDPPNQGEPEGYTRLFGDRKIYFAFGPKGIYAAVGNGAKDSLKTAIHGKPGPANAFDILANPKRLGQAVTTAEPNAGAAAEKVFGNEDKVYSAYTLSISGGDSLRLKFGVNLKILPKFMYEWFTIVNGG